MNEILHSKNEKPYILTCALLETSSDADNALRSITKPTFFRRYMHVQAFKSITYFNNWSDILVRLQKL